MCMHHACHVGVRSFMHAPCCPALALGDEPVYFGGGLPGEFFPHAESQWYHGNLNLAHYQVLPSHLPCGESRPNKNG
jgi:hypothetical protein